ncbi:MAG: carboxylate-amine ligase [Microcoleaceae cyanobacterium]
MVDISSLTIGVEEEYQIINPESRELIGRAGQIIPIAREVLGEDIVQPEMHRSQIEIATSICQDLAEVRQELTHSRRAILESAQQNGQVIAAAGTHPFSHWKEQKITPKERYKKLQQNYQHIIRDLIIFGCHVHIGMPNQEEAIAVINRARNWLSVLLALAANSPFWLGEKTGYASYRTELWYRFPLTGPPATFNTYQEYLELVQSLIQTDVIEDATTIYWDIRVSDKYPTIEFRVTDICQTVDEAVMITGLIQGLVLTCLTEIKQNKSALIIHPELLKTAHWNAARYGLNNHLIDVIEKRSIPAAELVNKFLNYIRPALEELGTWEEVSGLVQKTLTDGNAAQRQLQVYENTGNWEDVVDYVIEQTALGIL